MVAYATSAACLRATVLRHFGDPAAKEPCGACSNCHRRVVLDTGELELARKILSGIARCGGRFGRRKVAAMLAGEVDELPDRLRRLSTSGLLSGERPEDIEHWIDAARAGAAEAPPATGARVSLTPATRRWRGPCARGWRVKSGHIKGPLPASGQRCSVSGAREPFPLWTHR